MSGVRRLAAIVLAGWVALALGASAWPRPINAIDLQAILALPAVDALGGRDDLGRAQLPRLVAGARVSLAVALTVVSLTTTLGLFVGLVAGWYGGFVDLVLRGVLDVVLAFPGILLAIALAGILGPGLGNVVIALSAIGWAGPARLVRAQTLSLRTRDHVQVAHALGVRTPQIMFQHVLPLLLGPMLVEMTVTAAGAIVAEAGLSFLGLGVQAPTPSWGSMIRDGTRYLLVAPHVVLTPAVALASVVVSINLLGDQLRDRYALARI